MIDSLRGHSGGGPTAADDRRQVADSGITDWPQTPEMRELAYPIRKFASDLIRALSDFGGDLMAGYDTAMPLIEHFLANADLMEFGVHRQGHHVPGSVWLYYDYELEIHLSTPAPGVALPVHNHGTWELVAPYRGEMSYASYRQLSSTDGVDSGHAELEVADLRMLRQGDMAVVGLPHDIHAWTPRTDDLVLLSMNHGPLSRRRRYYDVEQNTYLVREPEAWRASALGSS
jgi:predicted metal-dependent enzyme (double-stranded beta helix superfamily)